MFEDSTEQRAAMTSRVRQNAGSSAIAAGMMIYFGFSALAAPSGNDLFSLANGVFFHTIRIGGIAMAVLAVWSLVGQRTVLIVDAVVSVTIGALLALTGIAMWIDGGGVFQSALNVMFGWMFISVGRRNWRDYFLFTNASSEPMGQARGIASAPAPSQNVEPRFESRAPAPPPQPSKSFSVPQDDPPSAVQQDDPPSAFESGLMSADQPPDIHAAPSEADMAEQSDPDDAPGGFLASFADDGPPPAP